MSENECKYSADVGEFRARLRSLEARIKILELIARQNSDAILTGKTERMVNNNWLDMLAKFLGYLLLALAFIAAGKVTGFADLLIKLFRG